MNQTPEAVSAALKLADTQSRLLLDRDAYRRAWQSILPHKTHAEEPMDAAARILAAEVRRLRNELAEKPMIATETHVLPPRT